MARIKPIKVTDDANRRILLETHIEYHPDSQFFFVRIPEEWKQMIEVFEGKYPIKRYVKRVTGVVMHASTQDEIETLFQKAGKEFYSSKKEQKKMILYQFQYRTKNFTSVKEKEGSFDWASQATDGCIDLHFDFKVVVKETLGQSVAYFDLDQMEKKESYRRPFKTTTADSVKSEAGRKDHWVEIDFTPEAEEFMKQVYNGLEGIFKKFTDFMGDKDRILKTLESKQKLLS